MGGCCAGIAAMVRGEKRRRRWGCILCVYRFLVYGNGHSWICMLVYIRGQSNQRL